MTSSPTRVRDRLLFLVCAAACALGGPASGSPVNLIVNGDFENVTGGASGQVGVGGFGVSDWTAVRLSGSSFSDPYNAVWIATSSAISEGGGGVFNVWSNSQMTLWGSIPPSPSGGNLALLEADWGWVKSEMTQTVTGLTPGLQYRLTFDWAAGQQFQQSGDTATRFDVRLGSESYSTVSRAVPDGTFVPWQSEVFIFTATAPTDTFGFLAYGTPSGNFPMAMIDNISLVEDSAPVPEIGTAGLGTMLALVTGTLGILERRRRRGS